MATAHFNHENVVAIVGVVTAGSPLLMVLEYCDQGALDGFLKASGAISQSISVNFARFLLLCLI